MHYLLFYEKAPDFEDRQKPLSVAHRDYLQTFATRGDLILGGSLENPTDGSAVLLFKADSAAAVEAVAQGDPYVKGGIVIKWSVRPWDLVIGSGLNAVKL